MGGKLIKNKLIYLILLISSMVLLSGCITQKGLSSSTHLPSSNEFTISNTPSLNTDYSLSPEKLSYLAKSNIGANMATLDYASDDRVILHYSYALIVYDLKNEQIYKSIDLSKLDVPLNTQGDNIIQIMADESGKEVFIGSYPAKNGYIFDIESSVITKIKGEYKGNKFTGLLDSTERQFQNGWYSINYVKTSSGNIYVLRYNGGGMSNMKIVRINENGNKTFNVF